MSRTILLALVVAGRATACFTDAIGRSRTAIGRRDGFAAFEAELPRRLAMETSARSSNAAALRVSSTFSEDPCTCAGWVGRETFVNRQCRTACGTDDLVVARPSVLIRNLRSIVEDHANASESGRRNGGRCRFLVVRTCGDCVWI